MWKVFEMHKKFELTKSGDDYEIWIESTDAENPEVESICLATTESDIKEFVKYKLQILQCEELFGVINIDKISKERYSDTSNFKDKMMKTVSFAAGMHEAVERNKEKVFTLEDMEFAMKHMVWSECFFGETLEETQKMRFDDIKSFLEHYPKAKERIPIEILVEMTCDTCEDEKEIHNGMFMVDCPTCHYKIHEPKLSIKVNEEGFINIKKMPEWQSNIHSA